MSKTATQEYKGNGEHNWEPVAGDIFTGETSRLRVPGGWLYETRSVPPGGGCLLNTVFVPMPDVVKHKV